MCAAVWQRARILYLLACIGDVTKIEDTASGKVFLFAGMAVSITVIEYIAGIALFKWMKLRLWDCSMQRSNIPGLVCPLTENNLAFSFVMGYFFGVFTIDVTYPCHLVARLKAHLHIARGVRSYGGGSSCRSKRFALRASICARRSTR